MKLPAEIAKKDALSIGDTFARPIPIAVPAGAVSENKVNNLKA